MNIKGALNGANGQATVAFATFLNESSVTVARSDLVATSVITLSIYADNDDVIANDWAPPWVTNITTSGFDIILRSLYGDFSGNVLVNWSIS